MITYEISFVGRIKGAIGIDYPITATVRSKTKESAVLALYFTYEHVQNPVVKVVR